MRNSIYLKILILFLVINLVFGSFLLNPTYILKKIETNHLSIILIFLLTTLFLCLKYAKYKIRYLNFIYNGVFTSNSAMHSLKNIIDIVNSPLNSKDKIEEINFYAKSFELIHNYQNHKINKLEELHNRLVIFFCANEVPFDIDIDLKINCDFCINTIFGVMTDIILNALKANNKIDKNGNKIDKFIQIRIKKDKRLHFFNTVKFEIINNAEKVDIITKLKIFFRFTKTKKHGYGLSNIFLGLDKHSSRLYCKSNDKETIMFFCIKEFKTKKINKTNFLVRKGKEKLGNKRVKIIVIEDSIAIQCGLKKSLHEADIDFYNHPYDFLEALEEDLDLNDISYILCDFSFEQSINHDFNYLCGCNFAENISNCNFNGKLILYTHHSHTYIKDTYKEYEKFTCQIPKLYYSLDELEETIDYYEQKK